MKHEPLDSTEDPRAASTMRATRAERVPITVGPRPSWMLFVAHHEDLTLLGRMVVLREGDNAVIGRRHDPFEVPVLLDRDISREHCEIVAAPSGLLVRDISTRGTTVNGHPRTSATLVDGDVLALGPVLLLVRRAPPVVARSPDDTIIGCGPAMAALLTHLRVAASGDHPVLLRGETGTGKEVIAAAIHRQSARAKRGYFKLALNERPEGLLCSELFGHVRGAFPGAVDHAGIVEHVEGGTLFLDEIAKCSVDVQGRLLRFLESKEFCRVGEATVRRANVRVIAASNEPLERLCERGAFLPDLRNRISGQTLLLPPLRARREDVPLLVHHFLRRLDCALPVEPELVLRLLRHPWKDNVRELRTVVEVAVASARALGASRIALTPFVEQKLSAIPDPDPPAHPPRAAEERRPSRRRQEVSREELVALLGRFGGNVNAAAREGRIARSTIYALIEHFELRLDDYRSP